METPAIPNYQKKKKNKKRTVLEGWVWGWGGGGVGRTSIPQDHALATANLCQE
jgi:hypothetical protein